MNFCAVSSCYSDSNQCWSNEKMDSLQWQKIAWYFILTLLESSASSNVAFTVSLKTKNFKFFKRSIRVFVLIRGMQIQSTVVYLSVWIMKNTWVFHDKDGIWWNPFSLSFSELWKSCPVTRTLPVDTTVKYSDRKRMWIGSDGPLTHVQ